MPREDEGRWVHSRFAAVVTGAVAASMVWLVVVSVVALTPGEAKERRASPDLPPPTVELRETTLRQITWHGCDRSDRTLTATAPTPPRGFRSVVTGVPEGGTKVDTGTRLGSVSGRPLIGVVTDQPLYRDLRVGDRGDDVRGLEKALRDARIIRSADGVLDSATVAAWRSRLDPSGPADVIALGTVVAVPPGASVDAVMVAVGDQVEPGAPLLEIVSRAERFSCDVPDPAGDITPTSVVFEIDGHEVPTAAVVSRARTPDAPGRVEVEPSRDVVGDAARLGIVAAQADGPSLVVPLSAIKAEADGRQVVVVVDGDDRRTVRVTTGLTAAGLVEIDGAGLVAGDDVALFGVGRKGS